MIPPPDSSALYLRKLLAHPSFSLSEGPQRSGKPRATLASLIGRYWAMDRDHRWERIEKAYLTLTGQVSFSGSSLDPLDPFQVIQSSYTAGKTDEFLEPTLLAPEAAMKSQDSVIFFNFRSDRAREISRALSEPSFAEFDRRRGFQPSMLAGMTTYDKTLQHVRVAFGPQNLDHIFGQWLEQHNLKQLRIAETEKYAHVTFFFNGGREAPFSSEERVLIPSAKDVPTYDLKPEMSAYSIADRAAEQILQQKYDFVLMNFANADMVGHTGNYPATVRAMETLDECLGKVIGSAERSGYHVLLTSDHGNAEEMRDEQGRHHTQHTLNPVPALWITPNSAIAPKMSRRRLHDGALHDIMPTLCDLMNLPIPGEVTGRSLVTGH